MKFGTISREEAVRLAPMYVDYIENHNNWDEIDEAFNKLKRRQKVVSYCHNRKQFTIAEISSINHNDFRAVDGPIVRVKDDKYSWRVDGNAYAYPI